MRDADGACRDWGAADRPMRPSFLSTRAFTDYPLHELVDFIDWTPFFATWEGHRRPVYGPRVSVVESALFSLYGPHNPKLNSRSIEH